MDLAKADLSTDEGTRAAAKALTDALSRIKLQGVVALRRRSVDLLEAVVLSLESVAHDLAMVHHDLAAAADEAPPLETPEKPREEFHQRRLPRGEGTWRR